MSKKWLNSNEVLSRYKDGNYIGVDLGLQPVDPSKIVGLSMDYEIVINDEKMKILKASVKRNGWNDPAPMTLGLIQTPSGEYVVDPAGNHRAVLANELKLSQIYAKVYRIYPISTFPRSVLNSVEELQKEKLNIMTYLEKNFDQESDESFEMVIRLDDIGFEIEEILYNYLKDNNLL